MVGGWVGRERGNDVTTCNIVGLEMVIVTPILKQSGLGSHSVFENFVRHFLAVLYIEMAASEDFGYHAPI
jgi:hypothetical protein